MKKKYSKLLEEYMNDILNIIREDTVQSVEINQKVLELVTDLANQRNVKEVGAFLENEIFKAKKMTDSAIEKKSPEEKKQDKSEVTHSSTNEYRYLLIKCVNKITQIHPETIPAMITPLMDSFLMFEKKGSMASLETIIFIREVIEVYPEHRQAIVGKLYSLMDDIKNNLVLRVAVWIVGEYSISQDEVDQAFGSIKKNIGSLPIFSANIEEEKKETAKEEGPRIITKTIILPDGSYGTETINLDEKASKGLDQSGEDSIPLRKSLRESEDNFLASCVGISLTKLAIKSKKNLNIKKFNRMSVESSLIICALLKGNKKTEDINNTQRL